MNFCLTCGNLVTNKFCNNSCSAIFNNKLRPPRTIKSRRLVSKKLTGRKLSVDTKKKISESLTGRNNTWIKSRSELTKKKISKSLTGHIVTKSTRNKLSKAAKKRNLGGENSKYRLTFETKSGKLVHLQSSYEIRFATLLEELNINWSRPKPFKWIDDKGVDHKYYPDFKIGKIYIDTKNDYLAKKDARKIQLVKEQNNIDLRIVTEDQINKEFIASLV